MEIRVLWLDDEFDSEALKSTFIRMEKHFTLIKCNTKEEFLDKIESEKWDAIVLDVLDANGRDSGFQTAVRRILKEFKNEPWFVFSGQANVTNKESDIRSMLKEEDCQREYADIIYIKSEHNDKLIEDVKNAVCNKTEWQIRRKYNDLFSWFPISDELLKILMSIETFEFSDVSCLNDIRKMLEWIRNLCVERGLLPENVKELNKFSKFMCDEKMKEDVPVYVQRSLHSCIVVSQEGSHLLSIDKSMKNGEAPYLLRSTVFELLNVLFWCKGLSSDAVSIEAMRNKIAALIAPAQNHIATKDVFEGVIEQDANGNYFCREYLLNYRDMQNEDIGKRIKIKKFAENTNERTKDSYPFFVVKQNFEILD